MTSVPKNVYGNKLDDINKIWKLDQIKLNKLDLTVKKINDQDP